MQMSMLQGALSEDLNEQKRAIQETRKAIMETCATTSLQYAGFVLALALISMQVLPRAGSFGDSNLFWIFEALLGMGMIHAVLNSAYFGRLSGLAGTEPPATSRADDYLSSITDSYRKRIPKFLQPYRNVYHKELILFIVAGIAIGCSLAFI